MPQTSSGGPSQIDKNDGSKAKNSDSTPSFLWPMKIIKTFIGTGNKRWFYCSLAYAPKRWILEEFVDPEFLERY